MQKALDNRIGFKPNGYDIDRITTPQKFDKIKKPSNPAT
jgi:hypothetical protein